MVDPPSAELRQRMDRVVLRAFSDIEPYSYAKDKLLVGAEESAGYAAKNVAATGAKAGAGVALVGCHPGWGILWPITCPAGLAGGAVVGVGTAVVGGAAGAAYGASQARSQAEIDAATATLDKSLVEMKAADVFRDHFVSAVHQNTRARIIEDDLRGTAARPLLDDPASPIIVAASVDTFNIAREGSMNPELSLHASISVDLFDTPEAGRRYTRGWILSSRLGGFYELTDKDGVGLRRTLSDALRKMAATIAEDLFVKMESVPSRYDKKRAIDGEVYTLYGSHYASTREWFLDQKSKAGCGDNEAQVALGRAYAAIDPRIYGSSARSAAIHGYVWLQRARKSFRNGSDTTEQINELTKRLSPEQIAEADALAIDWQQERCVVNHSLTQARPALPESAKETGTNENKEPSDTEAAISATAQASEQTSSGTAPSTIEPPVEPSRTKSTVPATTQPPKKPDDSAFPACFSWGCRSGPPE
jgi:hypothetical protein